MTDKKTPDQDIKDDAAQDELFTNFLQYVLDVSFLRPRTKYLYPLMRGVPFQDFYVALEMIVHANKKVVNDNRKHREKAHEVWVMEEAAQIAHREILAGKRYRQKPGPKPKKKRK